MSTSMKKKIILTITILLVLSISLFAYFYNSSKNLPENIDSENGAPNNQFPTPEPSPKFSLPDKDAEKMIITTNKGEIKTNNLYKNPIESLDKNGVLFEERDNFHSSFFPQDQGFLITVLDTDIEKGRREAEENFLQELGITKDEACKLKVDLGVPSFVNKDIAGQNYGLSFCPNGKPFPKK